MATAKIKKQLQSEQTTLFRRILIRLTIPLFFLAFIFMMVQLTNRIQILNELYKVESQIAFDSIQKELTRMAKKHLSEKDLSAYRDRLETAASRAAGKKISIQVYDLLNQKPLFTDANDWLAVDSETAEQSLDAKRKGVPYLLQVDKKTKHLLAFIPLQPASETNQIWVGRVLFPLAPIEDALRDSRWSLALTIFFISLTGLLIGRSLAKAIIAPIRELSRAAEEIMRGHLGKRVTIATGDEIEGLAHTFNHMSESLLRMRQQAEDANPLTGLPGNQEIFKELKKRIHEKQKFVMFHADLDRFKAFNDYYGLAKGDEVIKQTSLLLKESISEKGSQTDFIGHQGGDDFILICGPQHAKEVAEYVIGNFDKRICKAFYSKEDYDRGHMVAVDRRAELAGETNKAAKIPLMAISLAGISNAQKDFADYFDCLGRAVRVKSEVKKIPGSVYLIDE